jgi:hypothetical protein
LYLPQISHCREAGRAISVSFFRSSITVIRRPTAFLQPLSTCFALYHSAAILQIIGTAIRSLGTFQAEGTALILLILSNILTNRIESGRLHSLQSGENGDKKHIKCRQVPRSNKLTRASPMLQVPISNGFKAPDSKPQSSLGQPLGKK